MSKKTGFFIFSIALISSSSSWACPQLTGNYACVLPHSTAAIAIQQNGTDTGATYTFVGQDSSQTYVTDNQWYPAPPELALGMKDVSLRSRCEGSSLVVEIRGTQLISDAAVSITKEMSLTSEMGLHNITHNTISQIPTASIELDCDRK